MVASTLTVGAARSSEILRKFPPLNCRRFPQVGALTADAEPAFCDVGFLRFLTEARTDEKTESSNEGKTPVLRKAPILAKAAGGVAVERVGGIMGASRRSAWRVAGETKRTNGARRRANVSIGEAKMGYWSGKTVLVTGGSNGLGRVIAETFGAAGAQVAIVGLEAADVEATAEAMRDGGVDALPLVADVTKPEDATRIVEETVAKFGKLDALVNAAGRTHRGRILETPLDEFDSLWKLNVLGTIACSQAAAPQLIKAKGHIVNIGSLAAKSAARWVGAYPTTKHAVAAFSQQLRLETAPDGLHVLLVCPGPVKRDNPRLYPLKRAEGIPESALMPGGGVKVGKIDPRDLAQKILKACEKRRPEIVTPWKARLLFSIAQMFPRLGDWIVLKST